MTRRGVLKLGALSLFGLGMGFKREDERGPDALNGDSGKEKDHAELLEEIKRYRGVWGLDPLPAELLTPTVVSDEIWKDTSKLMFRNELTDEDTRVGTRTDQILRTIYGRRYCALVKGVRVDPSAPTSITFDWSPGVRMINFPNGIGNWITDENLRGYVLHEGAGHGTDPEAAGRLLIYSYDALLHLEHGKWKALTQALSVEGKFMQDRGDLMYPTLKRKIGEAIGRLVVMGGLEKQIKGEITPKISGLMSNREKFTKRKCEELGDLILIEMKAGRLKLVGEVEGTYKEGLEGIFVEIYAEMIKYAILYPEKIKYNVQIMEGVREIVSSIRGEDVSLDAIKNQLLVQGSKATPPLKRDGGGNKVTGWTVSVLVPEGESQTLNIVDIDMEYAFFAGKGEIPKGFNLPETDGAVLIKFALLYTEMVKKYPVLRNYVPYEFRSDFDPQGLHAWETRVVENAMDSTFVRQMFADKRNSQNYMVGLKNKLSILEKFVDLI